MSRYQSKPSIIEAVQHTGDFVALQEFAGEKVTIRPDDGSLLLLAGKDGAQEWVPVPLGHWLVHQPGDLSDVWPVDPDYFAAKYEPVVACEATLACGPGHQSKIKCNRTDRHHNHHAEDHSWCGDGLTFSGFFDEDPLCDH